MKKRIYIDGMTCGNCAKHVEIEIAKVSGVESVNVDLVGKYAEVSINHPLDRKELTNVLHDSGYKLLNIE